MTSKSNPTKSNSHLRDDFRNCRGRSIGDTDLVECLMGVLKCQWASPFGDTRFCKHPSAKQFVQSKCHNQP